jgi:hypothetical protein
MKDGKKKREEKKQCVAHHFGDTVPLHRSPHKKGPGERFYYQYHTLYYLLYSGHHPRPLDSVKVRH